MDLIALTDMWSGPAAESIAICFLARIISSSDIRKISSVVAVCCEESTGWFRMYSVCSVIGERLLGDENVFIKYDSISCRGMGQLPPLSAVKICLMNRLRWL